MESSSSPSSASSPVCRQVPSLLSSFVDAFVDFAVSGIFLPANPNPNSIAPPPPTHLPSPTRLIAIGDLHGDLPKSLQVLALAGILEPSTKRWTGGASVAIQVGDVLDRGGDEIRLLYLLHRLKAEATRAGGALITIHGNHEVMNVDMDFRYVTPEGLAEFQGWGRWYRVGMSMKAVCPGTETPRDPFAGVPREFEGVKRVHWEGFRARIAALRPNGPITGRFLAENQTVVVVGDSVFVHGGLLQEHVRYGLEKINDEVRDWIRGKIKGEKRKGSGARSPGYMRGRDSVVWLRRFSDGAGCDCEHLEGVLAMIPGAGRMVMGHTIQREGINAVCGDRAVRIDVGLSKGCTDGLPEVLEIVDGGRQVRILTSNRVYSTNKWPPKVTTRRGGEDGKGLALLIPDRNKTKPVDIKA